MKESVLAVIATVLLATGASATLVTNSTSFPADPIVIDFSQFVGSNEIRGTNGPVQIGGLVGADVVFTGTGMNGWLSNFHNFGLNANGAWTFARNGYAALNSSTDLIVFTSATPVSAVGGFMNYSPTYPNATIEVLGSGDVVLESYDLTSAAPISTSGNDQGAFRGIVRSSADIVAFRICGGYPVIDNLTFAGASTTSCTPDTFTACMLNNRFKVTVRYRLSFDALPADTQAFRKSVTGFANPNFETAFFYFNSENNIEMMVKMLDQGNTNAEGQPTIAVLFGTATPLGIELTITDTETNLVRTYTSAFNSQKGSTDFTAFVK